MWQTNLIVVVVFALSSLGSHRVVTATSSTSGLSRFSPWSFLDKLNSLTGRSKQSQPISEGFSPLITGQGRKIPPYTKKNTTLLVGAIGFESKDSKDILFHLLNVSRVATASSDGSSFSGKYALIHPLHQQRQLIEGKNHILLSNSSELRRDCDFSFCWLDSHIMMYDDKVLERLSTAMRTLHLPPSIITTSNKTTTNTSDRKILAPLFIVYSGSAQSFDRLQRLLKESWTHSESWRLMDINHNVITDSNSAITSGKGGPIRSLTDNIEIQVVLSPNRLGSTFNIETLNGTIQRVNINAAVINAVQISLNDTYHNVEYSRYSQSERDRQVNNYLTSSNSKTLQPSITPKLSQLSTLLSSTMKSLMQVKSLNISEKLNAHIDIIQEVSYYALQDALRLANQSIQQLNRFDRPEVFSTILDEIATVTVTTFKHVLGYRDSTTTPTATTSTYNSSNYTMLLGVNVTENMKPTLSPQLLDEFIDDLLYKFFDRLTPLYKRQIQLWRMRITQLFNSKVATPQSDESILTLSRGEMIENTYTRIPRIPRIGEEVSGELGDEPVKITVNIIRDLTLLREKAIRRLQYKSMLLIPSIVKNRKRLYTRLLSSIWSNEFECYELRQTIDEYIKSRELSYQLLGVLPRPSYDPILDAIRTYPIAVSFHTMIHHPLGLRDYRQDPLLVHGTSSSSDTDDSRRDRIMYNPVVESIQRDMYDNPSSDMYILTPKENKNILQNSINHLYPKDTSVLGIRRLGRRLRVLSNKWFGSSIHLMKSSIVTKLENNKEFCREMQMLPLFIQHPDTLPINTNKRMARDMSYLTPDPYRESRGPER